MRLTILSSLLAVFAVGCAPQSLSLAEKRSAATSQEIADLVQQLPAWNETSYDTTEIALLNQIVDDLRGYTLQELEDAIVYLYESGDFETGVPAQDSKAFLVLRILFKVPTSTPDADAKSFGGWIRPDLNMTSPPSSYDLLWPITISGTHASDVDDFQGYSGADYDAVGEFMYFKAEFGLR